jgi:hypothetical protein
MIKLNFFYIPLSYDSKSNICKKKLILYSRAETNKAEKRIISFDCYSTKDIMPQHTNLEVVIVVDVVVVIMVVMVTFFVMIVSVSSAFVFVIQHFVI